LASSLGPHAPARASPASFDPHDHAAALHTLQLGLGAMTAQRRAEEEHMRRVTGVRPDKHPQGGYGRSARAPPGRARAAARVPTGSTSPRSPSASADINAATAQAWEAAGGARAAELGPLLAEALRASLRRRRPQRRAA